MDFKLPEEVKTILERFTEAGFQIYIVGGAPRDLILGREVTDWDFTTDAKPEQILKILPNGFYNNQFGTVGIPANSLHTVFEITTMRKEGGYTDFRHPSNIAWTDKIEEDLKRRDFTINAMALTYKDAVGKSLKLVDPFNGQQDLANKLIRAAGDPRLRFEEDALRLMRAIRFAAQLEFTIEPQTFQAVKENAGLIHQISWERIRDELFKILATDHPYEGVWLLRVTGLLGHILPEVERCFGVVQQGPKHDRVYDIGEHSLLSLKYCPSKNPLVRFATLIHDIGKTDTAAVQPDGNVTFYGHDVVGGRLAKQVAQRLKLSKKEAEKLVTLVRWHLFTVDENQTDSAIRRFVKNVGVENVSDMMDLRIADRLGGGTQRPVSWRMEKFKEKIDKVLQKPFLISDLKIDGNDVMQTLNLKPGPKVGEILNKLFKEVLEDDSKNDRNYLMEKLKQFK